ncbi:MAG TPA: molybdopterin cofactor-binding domain-containing protein, partial [Pyrinomonadaceae bacterium]|nr:molybdopterin cofactor-binding domain-containing protein [Pyrinomonadaceae bacterium]
MIDERDRIDFIETERYELFEGPGYKFHFDRRDFIKAFGVGIVFIVPLGRALAQQRGQGESGRGGGNERQPSDIGAWIHIDEDGGVSVFTGKVEMGQNIRTSLAQAVADELHVPVATIRMVMGDTELTPFDRGT